MGGRGGRRMYGADIDICIHTNNLFAYLDTYMHTRMSNRPLGPNGSPGRYIEACSCNGCITRNIITIIPHSWLGNPKHKLLGARSPFCPQALASLSLPSPGSDVEHT